MSGRVPGGHNIALAEGESLHGDSDEGGTSPSRPRKRPGVDSTSTTPSGALSSPRYGSQSLPRNSGTDVRRMSGGSRKVDSLPVNLRTEGGPFARDRDASAERKRKAKGVIRSLGQFVQKVARQITSVSALAKSKAHGGKQGDEQTQGPDGDVSQSAGSEEGRRDEARSAAGEGDERIPGVVGIHNHGNTCYMNAVLQCLSNTERLLVYFITDQYKVIQSNRFLIK
jgi:hypothetical protein